MSMWRFRRGGGGGVLILDWRTLLALAVEPDLDAWLNDAKRQAQVVEWYAALGGARPKRGTGWSAQELRQVKPRLEAAFQQGELMAIPRDVVAGGPARKKDKGPEDLLVLTRSELERSRGLFELEDWLNDAMLQPLMVEIYKTLGGYIERVQWTREDLHSYLKPRLQEAFRNKELIALAPDLLPQKSSGLQRGQAPAPAPPKPQPPAPPVPAHPATSKSAGAAPPPAPAKSAGASGASSASPATAATKTWIEIVLTDEDGTPIGDVLYRIVLPDGIIKFGYLDAKGRGRVDGIDPGACQVSFPEIDGAEWRPA